MATKDLVIMDQNGQESIIPVEEIKRFIAPTASDAELWMFMGLAKAYNLNPLKKEIHFVKYGSGENAKANIIIGYEVYLKRAMATGKLEWWNVEIEGSNATDMKAVFKAKRADWSEPFTWEVYRSEFDKGLATWKAMPKFMLKKCAISQGLRLLFPEELGGMPYAPEEINGHTSEQINNASVIDAEFEEVEPEQKIEPEEDEKKKVLEKILKKIQGFKSLDELEKWASSQKIEKSVLKDEINAALDAKRKEFGPVSPEDMVQFEEDVYKGQIDEISSLVDLKGWYADNEEAISGKPELIKYLQKRENELKKAEGEPE